MDAIFLGLIALACILLWRLCQRNPKLAHIPGPKGIPIFGTLFEVHERLEFSCQKWVKKYGPVIRIPIFTKDLITLNNWDTIYEALVKRGTDFAGRPQDNNYRTQYMSNFKGLAFSDPNPTWVKLRKTSHAKLKQYDMGMRKIESIQRDIISQMVNLFRDAEGKSFDPHLGCYYMSLNTMAMLTCGRTYHIDQKEFGLFKKMETSASDITGPATWLTLFPFIRFFGAESYIRMVEFVKIRHYLYKYMRCEVMADPDKENTGGVLYALCKLYEEMKDVPVNHNLPSELREDMDELDVEIGFVGILIAGVVTTSRFYYAFLNIIAQHPRIQKLLQEEVDSVVGPSNVVTLNDRPNMPYTQATVYELLRYCTITPFNLPHCTLRDSTVGGILIPKGTEVHVNTWLLHHDQDFWDAPWEFRPERFLDDDGQVVDKSHPNRQHLMVFGAGTRVCLGEQIGLSRMFLLTSTTAQMFDIKTGPQKISCDCRDFTGTTVLNPPRFEIVAVERNDQLYLREEENGVAVQHS